MGFVKARVRVSNPNDRAKHVELELLVDTGATFTLVPGKLLTQIGVQPEARFTLKMADGKFIERDASTVLVETEGRGYKVPVVAGQDGDIPVLGVTTLEILGLEVDPVSRKLKPTDYLLL
jgi:clan AA aspartic protease